MNKSYYEDLIHSIRKLPKEAEWVEFKVNNADPEMIGEYISALSNSAAILGREMAYIVWGIENETHDIIGTEFHPLLARVGNEELENWLSRLLSPRVDFKIIEISVNGLNISIIEIPRATGAPTRFKTVDYIRVGSYKKPLRDYPEKERKLWLSFETKPYDLRSSIQNINAAKVTELLDCAAYYSLMKLPLPESRESIIYDMLDNKFIYEMDNGAYGITNMGGLLLAKDINTFDNLKRKAIRVIKYKGEGRTTAVHEEIFTKGYAVQFDDICRYIMTLIPQEEEIGGGRRIEHIMFPEKSIREMLANIMIHQDLTIRGTGPMMEVFDTRVEASSPGGLLIDVDRIIDTAPHARNEAMAAFLRIVHICEERGSGFDRIEEGLKEQRLPSTKVEGTDDFCRTKIFWRPSLKDWTKEELIRTCYIYTCYCYVNNIEVSNAVLRERFGVEERNKATVSRIIKDALTAGLIKISDENASAKYRRYIPYWA